MTTNEKKMLRVLRARGAMSALDAARIARIDASAAYRAVRLLHKAGEIHVLEYARKSLGPDNPKSFVTIRVLCAGAGEDARRPEPGPRKRPLYVPIARVRTERDTRRILTSTRRILRTDGANPFASLIAQVVVA